MMDVLQIGKGWFPEESGGLNRYFYDCVRYLPSPDMSFQGLVTGSSQVEQDSQQQVRAFGTTQSSLLSRWALLRKTFQQLQRSQRAHLVSVHFALYAFPILDLIEQPLVMHFHGPWAIEGQVEGNNKLVSYTKKQLERAVYGRAKRFIVLSEAFKQILATTYDVPEDKISVVPGGVDLQRFDCSLTQSEARQSLGWPEDRPIIFAVRRLAKRMGLEQLIQAIAQIRQQHPDILVFVAGKGARAAALQAQIDELDLTQNVRLLGYVKDADLPLGYRAANFSIVPTQSLEGFGLILLEALATGTPVLGTPVGGIPEVLRPLDAGLVLSGTQTADIAQAIQEVLQGERKLPSAAECRQYIEQNYTWPVITRRLREIYQAAC